MLGNISARITASAKPATHRLEGTTSQISEQNIAQRPKTPASGLIEFHAGGYLGSVDIFEPSVTGRELDERQEGERCLVVPSRHPMEMHEVLTHPFHRMAFLVQRMDVVANDSSAPSPLSAHLRVKHAA